LPLRTIVTLYPGPWARASNAAGPSTPIPRGLVREHGIVCGAAPLGDGPQLVVRGNSALILDPCSGSASAGGRRGAGAARPDARLAVHGEVMLVRDGRVACMHSADTEDLMVCLGTCGRQALHAVAMCASRSSMARFLVECGCTDALLVVQGEACGLMVYGERRMGGASAPVPAAMVIRDLLPVGRNRIF
jgi:hypothetical protein